MTLEQEVAGFQAQEILSLKDEVKILKHHVDYMRTAVHVLHEKMEKLETTHSVVNER